MSRAPNIVLFDDQCPMCTFQMRLVTWLDWFNTAAFMPMSDPHAREVAPGLTPEVLSAAMHCVTADGRIFRGARCIRHLGMRIPLLVPMALTLWFPGVIWVAEKIYAHVSRNRYVLSRVFGCKEACAVLPQRQRRRESEDQAATGKP
jgi:predicted DCC family thiol-disulfide oxidoreductase YuxK